MKHTTDPNHNNRQQKQGKCTSLIVCVFVFAHTFQFILCNAVHLVNLSIDLLLKLLIELPALSRPVQILIDVAV